MKFNRRSPHFRFYRSNPLLYKLFPGILWHGNREKRTVYLTFDDGPDPQFTPQILDILARYSVPAVFFLVGQKADRFPQLARRIAEEGHTPGNHSFSHEKMILRDKDWIRNQLLSTQRSIEKAAGITARFFRPPYGWFDKRLLKIATELKLETVIWDLLPYDTVADEAPHITERILKYVRGGSIIDLHDGHARSSVIVAALPGLIAALRDRGMQFASLDEDFPPPSE